jgi:hypothetical protein
MKHNLLAVFVTAGALLMPAVPARAHHSFGATYDASKEITVKGKIVQVSLRSPHSFFFIEAEDEKGVVQRWSIEGAAAGQFAKTGVTRDVFQVGDVVEVICNPARSATSYRGRLLKITRPSDGKSWGGRAGETFE